VASSPHQIEGNNVDADLWLAERVMPTIFAEPSGCACDGYRLFREDIALAADLGFNCYRFGIEWSRIEPVCGEFSNDQLDHYRRVLEACHARGLAPMVTYCHFTLPRWFAARGGFEVAGGADLFARFAAKATESLGDLISHAVTFNEANIRRIVGLLLTEPEVLGKVREMLAACARSSDSDRFSTLLFSPSETLEPGMLKAHAEATAAIKAGPGQFPVGLTLSMQDIQGVGEGHCAENVAQALYGPWLEAARAADFIGVQTYTRIRVGPSGRMPVATDAERTDAGFELYPAALGGAIRFAHERIGKPIYVTENGVATSVDSRRIAFIDTALAALRDCLDEGIDVRSYVHWSLLDSFEWFYGYAQRYGLVEVDRQTFGRRSKPSARHLGKIAQLARAAARLR
jgi:beta-glucosidase